MKLKNTRKWFPIFTIVACLLVVLGIAYVLRTKNPSITATDRAIDEEVLTLMNMTKEEALAFLTLKPNPLFMAPLVLPLGLWSMIGAGLYSKPILVRAARAMAAVKKCRTLMLLKD